MSTREITAGEYVLGLLEDAELAQFERDLARDASLREEAARWQAQFAPLDASVQVMPVPATLWSRIEASLGSAQREREIPSISQKLWDNLGFWRGASFAGAFASLVLAVSVGLLAGRATPVPLVVAVLQTDDATPGAIVEAFHDGRVVVVPLRDIQVPEGKALEVWTLFDKARGPVSLGLIDRTRRAQFSTANLPARETQLYEITLEPATGSPIGRPTGPILMKGLAAAPRI